MTAEAFRVLPLLKEIIIKVFEINNLDVDVIAASLRESRELSVDRLLFKEALTKLLSAIQTAVNGSDQDMPSTCDTVAGEECNAVSSSSVDRCSVDNSVSTSTVTDVPTTNGDSRRHSVDEVTDTRFDPQFVFLARSKLEIDDKIAKYIETKQHDNNEINVREFCGLKSSDYNVDESCARTSAVFQPRSGHSHLIVQKVVNEYGPQMKIKSLRRLRRSSSAESRQADCNKSRATPSTTCRTMDAMLPSGVEERIVNMEVHLKLYAGRPVPRDVYRRLQNLENRLTYLESLSPEYFDHTSSSGESRKKAKLEQYDIISETVDKYKNMSPTDVHCKILQLKQQLSRRARELKTLQTR